MPGLSKSKSLSVTKREVFQPEHKAHLRCHLCSVQMWQGEDWHEKIIWNSISIFQNPSYHLLWAFVPVLWLKFSNYCVSAPPGQLYPFSYRCFRGIMFPHWLRKIIEFCVKNYHSEVTFMSMENFVAWSKKILWAPNFSFSPCRHKNDGPCQSECVQVLIPLQQSIRAGLTWKAVMLIRLNLQEFDSVGTTWHLVWKV